MDDPRIRNSFSVLLNRNQNGRYYVFAEGVTNILYQINGEWSRT